MINRDDAECQIRRLLSMPGAPKDRTVINDYIDALIRCADHETHAVATITSLQDECARCPSIAVMVAALRGSSTAEKRICPHCQGAGWLTAGLWLVTTLPDARGGSRHKRERITEEQAKALRSKLSVSRQMVYEASERCGCGQ